MFEHASIDTRALKNPWAITTSVTVQTLLLVAGILVSLIRTDTLPRTFPIATIAAPGAQRKVAAQVSGPATVHRPRASHRLFVPPAKVNDTVESKPQDAAIALSPHETAAGPGESAGSGALSIFWGAGLPGVPIARMPPLPPPVTPRILDKPAAPVAAKPVAVSSGVQAAKLRRLIKPIYPPLALQARISGTVRLAAIIGREGVIQNLQVVSGHPLLAPAAVEAVKQWHYHPTLLNGEVVEVITQIDVNFTLSQ